MITCTAPDCAAPILSSGLCRKHYVEMREKRLATRPCITEGCGKPQHCRGLCRGHYARQRSGRRFDVPLTAPAAQTSRRVTLFLSPELIERIEAHGKGDRLTTTIRDLILAGLARG